MTGWDAILYLEKGYLFEGQGFGAESPSGGEAVFNTGLTGYQEIFTDPSYLKQIVVMGAAHIGNTGINFEDPESKGVALSGVVVREYCPVPSNWRSKQTLSDYLARANVPMISDVDTREITQVLRDEGSQRAIIFPKSLAKGDVKAHAATLVKGVEEMEGLELVSKVSCREPYLFESSANNKNGTIVVYDYGAKANILRSLASRGFRVQVVPYNLPASEVMAFKPLGLCLSNGPGDPAQVQGAVPELQALVGKVPILAVCMGHQLLARALGAETFKLKFGHHATNHPVKDIQTGRILITSQNHGFSVSADSFKTKDVTISHVSLNDGTVEGFQSDKLKILSAQFHPEAKPGPNDASYLFDNFVRGFLK